jgi:hypothetical protein
LPQALVPHANGYLANAWIELLRLTTITPAYYPARTG